MSSREIAELLDCRHDKVKQSIERLAKRGVIGLPPLGEYLDTLGRKATEYRIGKRDSYVIVAQLSPEFTAKLVDRWQELEALGEDESKFAGIYLDAYNREKPCFNLPKDLTITLVSGYNVQMRYAITKRWMELEARGLSDNTVLRNKPSLHA